MTILDGSLLLCLVAFEESPLMVVAKVWASLLRRVMASKSDREAAGAAPDEDPPACWGGDPLEVAPFGG